MYLKKKYYYEGNDLGNVYQKDCTKFRVWVPTADEVLLKLYKKESGGKAYEVYKMEKENSDKSTWHKTIKGDLNGVYYTYLITIEGKTCEVVDIYAKNYEVNGKRGMVIDMKNTNPEGWEADTKPPFQQIADAVICGIQIRDFSDENIDYIKELGVTHVHLFSESDFSELKYTNEKIKKCYWGYNPINYSLPQGYYVTNLFDGGVSIKGFKQMVKSFHDKGLRVVIDAPSYCLNKTNDFNIAEEKKRLPDMNTKFIIDSISYWAREFHVDGFCFNFINYDIQTMKKIRYALNEIDPTILIYGDGWNMTSSFIEPQYSVSRKNIKKLPEIAMFSEFFRTTVVGDTVYHTHPGFVNGLKGLKKKIKLSLVGGVNYSGTYKIDRWTENPTQSINYTSGRLGLTTWDKIICTNPRATKENKIAMYKMAAVILFVSQGIPFFQLGDEFLRGKGYNYDENNYNDKIKTINWEQKEKYLELFEYYKGLIAFRKKHPALRLSKKTQIDDCIFFLDSEIVSYIIDIDGEMTECLWIVINSETKPIQIDIPPVYNNTKTKWKIYINEERAGVIPIKVLEEEKLIVPARSCFVLCKENE